VAFVNLVRNFKQHKLIVLRILNEIMLSNINDVCLKQLPLTCVTIPLSWGREYQTHYVWLVSQKECNAFVFNGAVTLDHPSTLEDDGTVDVLQNVRNSLPVHTAKHTITQAFLI